MKGGDQRKRRWRRKEHSRLKKQNGTGGDCRGVDMFEKKTGNGKIKLGQKMRRHSQPLHIKRN